MITERTDRREISHLTWIGWLPLPLLCLATITLKAHLPAWAFMWLLAISIYAGLKWLTWWESAGAASSSAQSLAYLLLWPGMDADRFLAKEREIPTPRLSEWSNALLKTLIGILLLWLIVPLFDSSQVLLIGWTGMLGLILLLHFGTFHLLSLFWRQLGVDAQPIMINPLRSTSLSEFWGKRWNLDFRQLSHHYIFNPLRERVGVPIAMFLVFVASGLLHDLVISLPANAGYGLPTAYFAIQGLGVLFERGSIGKSLTLGKGLRGWLFTLLVTAGPAFILFHQPFVESVILPFLAAIGAR